MSPIIDVRINTSVIRTGCQAEAIGSAINRLIHYFMKPLPPQLTDSEACTKALMDGEDRQ